MVLALANFAPREDGPRDRPFNERHSSVFTACVSLSMWSLETARLKMGEDALIGTSNRSALYAAGRCGCARTMPINLGEGQAIVRMPVTVAALACPA